MLGTLAESCITGFSASRYAVMHDAGIFLRMQRLKMKDD